MNNIKKEYEDYPNRLRYVYNINMADFFMKKGLRCLSTGVNKNSKRTYWCFDYVDSQEYQKLWEIHKRNRDRFSNFNKNNKSE